jgi:uncharacterized protein YndB with AHSA1/START domain/DNA-binding transcriptional ArsR family regulator
MDLVFKALGDPTRRRLLDLLHAEGGQTLGQLCAPLDMARQSVTQHLALLEAARLVVTVRRGREKLHYLNPVPLHEIQRRWIGKFELPRLAALAEIKTLAESARQAEETGISPMTSKPDYVYVTYIQASAERVWQALTDADLTAAYWGHANVSDWRPGSPWRHVRVDGSGIADVAGTVVEAIAPTRLKVTFDAPGASPASGAPSMVTFDIEPYHEIVKVTVTHQNVATDLDYRAVSAGWPAVMANLKSLLETGHVLPRAPWEMHAGLREEQMARNDPR